MTTPFTFTVMTVNLRFGLAEDGANAWDRRKTAYPSLFADHAPDLVGVQEANDFQTEYLAGILGGYGHIGDRVESEDPPPPGWQDNIIFFRKSWMLRTFKHFYLSDTPEVPSQFPESRWPRQCTIGHFENSGRSLIHVNTHFDFAESVQERSAGVLIDLLAGFPSGLPTLITGDFNTSPGTRTYETFMEEGFIDPFANRHTSTFHGFTGKDLGGHIDWILYRGGMKNTGCRIVHASYNGIYPSDHYPVTAVFEME